MSEKTKKPATAPEAEAEVPRERQKPAMGRLIVSATAKEGRRRAGLEFSQAGTPVNVADLTQEQWEQILDDPQLTLRPAKDEAEPAA
jgi:hypothetical protein